MNNRFSPLHLQTKKGRGKEGQKQLQCAIFTVQVSVKKSSTLVTGGELLFPDSLFLRCRLFWATCRSSGCLGNGSPLRRLAQCHTFFCVCLSVSVSLWMETVWVWSKKGGVWRARAESKENWEREDDIPSDKWVGVTVLSEAAKRNTGAWSEACPLSSSTRPWPLYLWSVYMLEGAIKMKMLTIFSSFLPRTHTHTPHTAALPGHAGCCGCAKLPLCS